MNENLEQQNPEHIVTPDSREVLDAMQRAAEQRSADRSGDLKLNDVGIPKAVAEVEKLRATVNANSTEIPTELPENMKPDLLNKLIHETADQITSPSLDPNEMIENLRRHMSGN